eukprot:TRINITY_DN2444_c0_g1_i1.p1 TRINITY_DN2444_c0_g1~~TRINITY_DN2444_c0_g1_i1.p1  ORF type:complete len:756 (-),score=211.13 TRINITY_DN2444_c0_g1_i1:41-2308(-)
MAPPSRLQLTVSLLTLAVAMATSAMGVTALKSTYNASTELDGSTATLHWTLSASTIQLALVVTAPSVVTPNASALWVGFGIGDPQSGGMVGADIVTAEYGTAAAGGANCSIVDRHVPMVAYPLLSDVGGDAVFPAPDDCPAIKSWSLVACGVDFTTGTMTLEASRSLAAPNPTQDRDIVAGRNILMYAYGDGFAYHGAARRSVEVDLTAGGASAVLAGDLVSTGALPADADDSILLTMPNYAVSTNRTDYACVTFEVEPPAPGTVKQMIAAEAIIDLATSGGRLVHHLGVVSCDKTPMFDSFKAGKECLTMLPACTDTVFGWAVGAKPLVFPDEAGFPITNERRFFLLQVHYDNPEALSAVVDSSSVRLHTTSRARKYDSGVIALGNMGIFMGDERVMSKNYTYTCPSECTGQMAGPVNVFYSVRSGRPFCCSSWSRREDGVACCWRSHVLGFPCCLQPAPGLTRVLPSRFFLPTSSCSLSPAWHALLPFPQALHAHYTATQMWTNVYRNGSFYRTVEAVKHWSNEHQRPTLFSPFTLLPGDRLTVSAEYNVDKLVASGDPAPAWGLGTHDEMLLTALFVYPRPTRVGPNTTVGDTLTACGGVFLPDAGEQWTICSGRQAAGANASAAVEGIDVFNRSALAVPDEAGWADPFNEAPACAAGTDGGGDAGAAGGHGPPPRIVHEANLAEYTAASRVVYERSQRRVEGVDGGGGVGGKAPPESALSEAEREHAKGNRWFVGATVAAFGAYRAVGDEY